LKETKFHPLQEGEQITRAFSGTLRSLEISLLWDLPSVHEELIADLAERASKAVPDLANELDSLPHLPALLALRGFFPRLASSFIFARLAQTILKIKEQSFRELLVCLVVSQMSSAGYFLVASSFLSQFLSLHPSAKVATSSLVLLKQFLQRQLEKKRSPREKSEHPLERYSTNLLSQEDFEDKLTKAIEGIDNLL